MTLGTKIPIHFKMSVKMGWTKGNAFFLCDEDIKLFDFFDYKQSLNWSMSLPFNQQNTSEKNYCYFY